MARRYQIWGFNMTRWLPSPWPLPVWCTAGLASSCMPPLAAQLDMDMLKTDSCWGKIFVNFMMESLITLDHAIWIFSPFFIFFVLFFHVSHLVAGSKTKGDFSENFRPDDQLLAASSRLARRFARRFASQGTKFWLLPARSCLEQPWPVRLRLRMETSCHVGNVTSYWWLKSSDIKKAVISMILWYFMLHLGFLWIFNGLNSSHVMSLSPTCHAQQKNTPAGKPSSLGRSEQPRCVEYPSSRTRAEKCSKKKSKRMLNGSLVSSCILCFLFWGFVALLLWWWCPLGGREVDTVAFCSCQHYLCARAAACNLFLEPLGFAACSASTQTSLGILDVWLRSFLAATRLSHQCRERLWLLSSQPFAWVRSW